MEFSILWCLSSKCLHYGVITNVVREGEQVLWRKNSWSMWLGQEKDMELWQLFQVIAAFHQQSILHCFLHLTS